MITEERYYGGSRARSTGSNITLAFRTYRVEVVETSAAIDATLPDATTFYSLGGPVGEIIVSGTHNITLKDKSGATLKTLTPGNTYQCFLVGNSTAAGSWAFITRVTGTAKTVGNSTRSEVIANLPELAEPIAECSVYKLTACSDGEVRYSDTYLRPFVGTVVVLDDGECYEVAASVYREQTLESVIVTAAYITCTECIGVVDAAYDCDSAGCQVESCTGAPCDGLSCCCCTTGCDGPDCCILQGSDVKCLFGDSIYFFGLGDWCGCRKEYFTSYYAEPDSEACGHPCVRLVWCLEGGEVVESASDTLLCCAACIDETDPCACIA